jgi:hypothetical protein
LGLVLFIAAIIGGCAAEPRQRHWKSYTNVPKFGVGDLVSFKVDDGSQQIAVIQRLVPDDNGDGSLTWRYDLLIREQEVQFPTSLLTLVRRMDWNELDTVPPPKTEEKKEEKQEKKVEEKKAEKEPTKAAK